ncbi:HlyC/CorC family transporter [Chromobacterium haemolyticum]|uniref:Polyamine export protein n=2 Tax=Chromobacteriaceae TaxID=1499392 RepID=A0ABS3GME0_9NEIS|nr:HlyC/CorC family transporter [Chromobacterium haemolyticum]MBO0499297.1 HlyC/CorC family transporter [Chromobacterium haemolyticum]
MESLMTDMMIILALILASAFFSVSEISLAASRKIRLRQMLDEGNDNAGKVLALQEHPGHFFTVVQIGVNAVAILGGIVGEAAFTPFFARVLGFFLSPELAQSLGFLASFLLVTSLFILFADLTPKRVGMVAAESVAVRIVRPMLFMVLLFKPLVWLFNEMSGVLLRLAGMPTSPRDEITSDDISAMMDAGAEAGVLHRQEHQVIENVFELESRLVPSSMTPRESIIYFTLDEGEESIKSKVAEQPHSKFLVCDNGIDNVVGYVDSKDLLRRVLAGRAISLKEPGLLKTVLMIPDSLTLSESLDQFKGTREDFAVILNEYGFVVGLITLNDVMSTVMGDLVGQGQEEQIVKRDENSWLVDGITPVEDVLRVLEIDELPDDQNYETVAGFMMYMLRKIPRRTDCVQYAGYKFEVVDIDNHKIDQILVTRVASKEPAQT